MTDLGNGLFAVNIKERKNSMLGSFEFGSSILWVIKSRFITIFKGEKSVFEILGIVTKDIIDFDVAKYCDINRGNVANEIYFRSLLSSKGLYFENPQYTNL